MTQKGKPFSFKLKKEDLSDGFISNFDSHSYKCNKIIFFVSLPNAPGLNLL